MLTHSTRKMQAIHAQERGVCTIPLADLVDKHTGIFTPSIFAQNSSLIDFRYAGEDVKIIISGIVGHLPLTNSHTLVISPKFPISNMSRMIWRSNEPFQKTAPINRSYELLRNETYSLEYMLRTFAHHMAALLVEGVHRNYTRNESVDIPRPRIDFRKTQQKFWSKGIYSKAHITKFNFTSANILNSIIKLGLLLAIRYLGRFPLSSNERSIFNSALEAFSSVSPIKSLPSLREVNQAITALPSFRSAYSDATTLALEIIKGSSLRLESYTGDIISPSFLINLEMAFEGYIRNSLKYEFHVQGTGIDVLDGNKKKWTQKLLNDSKLYDIKPDLLFRVNGKIEAIGDAKYKPKLKEEDRYQIITHALSVQCKKAVLIYPCSESIKAGLNRIGCIGPKDFEITLYEYGVALDQDLKAIEENIAQDLANIIKA